jgi:hypothetical protein
MYSHLQNQAEWMEPRMEIKSLVSSSKKIALVALSLTSSVRSSD